MKKIPLIIAFTVLVVVVAYLLKTDAGPEIYRKIEIKEVFSGIIARDEDDCVYSGQIKSEAGLAEFEKSYGVALADLTLDFKNQMLIFGITDEISTRAFQFMKHENIRFFTLDYVDTGIQYKLARTDEGEKHSYIQVFVSKKIDGIAHVRVKNIIRNGLSKVYDEFEIEPEKCIQSRHPAESNKAKWNMESLERQKEYEKATFSKSDKSRAFAEVLDFRLRIRDDSSDEKVITRANLMRIKEFILRKGLRSTYCNMYNNNPVFSTKNYSYYLNPDTRQGNINCDIDKSDFHNLTIRSSGSGKGPLYQRVDFLDKHDITIIVSWPGKDLTVSQTQRFMAEAIKDILTEIEKE